MDDGTCLVDSDQRVTPQWLVDELNREFAFEVDLAATSANCRVFIPHSPTHPLVPSYFGPDHELAILRDSLLVPWHRYGKCGWLNGPYSRGQILKFCAKAEAEAEKGFTTVSLIPGDVSTEYYHRYVLTGERRTIKTRLKFEGAPLDKHGKLPPAKFGSVLRIWRPSHKYWSFA